MARKIKTPGTARQASDKASRHIAAGILTLQKNFAKTMNRRTHHFSKRLWQTITVLFAVAWTALSVYLLRTAISQKPLPTTTSKQLEFRPKPGSKDSLHLLEKIYQQHKK